MHSSCMAYWEYCQEYKKPFVVYRLPQSEEYVTLVISADSVTSFSSYAEIQEKKGFVFTPFNAEQNQNLFIEPEEVLVGDKGFRGDLFLDKNEGIRLSHLEAIEESKEAYQERFAKMHAALASEQLDKVILSKTITISEFPEEECIYMYHNLAEAYADAMVFWVFLPHLGIEWMGATPELLLRETATHYETLALAGTKNPEEDWTEKERQEQQLVVAYIDNVLCDFEKVDKTNATVQAGNIQHLSTTFKVCREQADYFDVVENLHPTPAICGIPVDAAKEIISAVEAHNRKYYCGFLGPINILGEKATFVNLRSMQFGENAVRLYVGGGLTLDSVCEKEWEETERKADTLRRFLY